MGDKMDIFFIIILILLNWPVVLYSLLFLSLCILKIDLKKITSISVIAKIFIRNGLVFLSISIIFILLSFLDLPFNSIRNELIVVLICSIIHLIIGLILVFYNYLKVTND